MEDVRHGDFFYIDESSFIKNVKKKISINLQGYEDLKDDESFINLDIKDSDSIKKLAKKIKEIGNMKGSDLLDDKGNLVMQDVIKTMMSFGQIPVLRIIASNKEKPCINRDIKSLKSELVSFNYSDNLNSESPILYNSGLGYFEVYKSDLSEGYNPILKEEEEEEIDCNIRFNVRFNVISNPFIINQTRGNKEVEVIDYFDMINKDIPILKGDGSFIKDS